jgi:hypothetical protein
LPLVSLCVSSVLLEVLSPSGNGTSSIFSSLVKVSPFGMPPGPSTCVFASDFASFSPYVKNKKKTVTIYSTFNTFGAFNVPCYRKTHSIGL